MVFLPLLPSFSTVSLGLSAYSLLPSFFVFVLPLFLTPPLLLFFSSFLSHRGPLSTSHSTYWDIKEITFQRDYVSSIGFSSTTYGLDETPLVGYWLEKTSEGRKFRAFSLCSRKSSPRVVLGVREWTRESRTLHREQGNP